MLERFREHLRSSGLIPGGASILVGYSGGADSTCLLHLLKECGIDVAAGHLHHGQRPEADNELKRCEAFCQNLDIPFVSGRADVPKMASELKIGLEEAGRKARYTFLQNAAFRLQCDLIATAHTRGDLVETVLLNLTRGCGLHGLTGIPEQRENIVRPLLQFSRAETRSYCESQGFWFHDDPANSDVSFSRARIRHRVIKELRTINAGFDDAVARMVGIVDEEDRFLNGMAAAALEQSEKPLNGHLRFLTIESEVAFDKAKLTGLPPVLFKRSIRLAVEALGGALDFAQTELIANRVGTNTGSVTAEEGKVVVEWTDSLVHVRRVEGESPFRHPLTVPGETSSDEFGWTIDAIPAPAGPGPSKRTDLTVKLDVAKLKGQLYFRTLKAGDEMKPVGFDGHRKLATLLSDAKLTKAARARLPIVCDLLGPIWAPGVCLDARAAANVDAKQVLALSFGPIRIERGAFKNPSGS
jgi:tRNA(Ile)-lysidine synthase